MRRHGRHDGRTTRILIVGGGFGGLAAARELDRRLAGRPDVHVTLVNRDNFLLFTPMLHEVAASDLDLTHIVTPLRRLLHHVDLFVGEVEAIDLESRRVTVSHGDGHHHHVLDFDHLVLALGSVTNFFGLPGLAERALTMKTLGDAIHLRNRLIRLLEEADVEPDAALRQPLLTIVVAGGGFAGVETVAAVNDFVRAAIGLYPHLHDARLRLVLVHAGPRLLPELDDRLGEYAAGKLAARGVEVRLATRVLRADDYGVVLSDRSFIAARTLVWTAGTTPQSIAGGLPCADADGRITVGPTLAVPGWPGVWAVGDCARVPDLATGGSCPPTAQHAIRQGKTLAQNLIAASSGASLRPFSYRTLGQLAAIGQRTGVAQIFGARFSGFAAWWLWRSIYLAKLPRLEKKVRVALDWTLDLLFTKDIVQYTTGRAPTISAEAHGGEPLAATGTSSRDPWLSSRPQ